MSPLCFSTSHHQICANSCTQTCSVLMLQLQTGGAWVWGSSDVNQTPLVHCFFHLSGRWGCTFPLPLAMTVIRVNRACGTGGFIPCVPGQAAEMSCLMITLSLLWGAGEARGGDGEDELVTRASPLSHTEAGLLALSPPAPSSAVDECVCHSGRPCVSISWSLLLTATDSSAALPLPLPEHTVLLFLKVYLPYLLSGVDIANTS